MINIILMVVIGYKCGISSNSLLNEIMSSSSKATKRKRVVLTIADKLKVCELVKQNVPKVVIMEQFKIAKSTLNDIIRSETSLRNFKKTKLELGISQAANTSKQIKTGLYEKLDESLYIWLRQQREKGSPITGPILLEKAKEFHSLLYGDSGQPFNASSGFQWRFCKRHGIKSLAISGEKLSSNTFAAEKFVQEFPDSIEGYSLDQVFNCDESGLYFRMLPGRTLTTTHAPPSGTKKAKERVTISACSNATGSIKLPLLLIGKSKNPRCFKSINMAALPVVYRSQKNAWVNTSIFEDWFKTCFVPEVKKQLESMGQESKAILILDNCSAHPDEHDLVSEDGNIVAKFLPPNVTALIQPINQGVLESNDATANLF